MYYILDLLDTQHEVPPILSSQDFFNACIQLIHGEDITNTNIKIPKQSMTERYQEYAGHCPQASFLTHIPGYKHALDSLADQSTAIFLTRSLKVLSIEPSDFFALNCSVLFKLAQFRSRRYFRQLFDNVPKPTNVKTLSAHAGKHLPFLRTILREYENFNTEQINSAEVVQTKANNGWVRTLITSLEEFSILPRQSRSCLVRQIVAKVKSSGEVPPLVFTYLSERSIEILRTTINEAKSAIAN
ncbi:uncharacterized protein BYT42DRAFT_613378 [Radiomyces spectabilis]|uniref:uncharacterized protein n=1 Tax=Radiomyces spectabilis TaxID=64574 RepID=UPI0022207109|nr:uncharacterized protein BYT42DRAFT_613378 [Radiomyces spectabilis]KAI8381609.1 hypothetical protein BYT42DRAFT_613378 [Radiomyces spectabilis]